MVEHKVGSRWVPMGGRAQFARALKGFSASVTFSDVAVNFPDPNLRAAVEIALNKAPGTPIAPSEMASLIHLEAANANITNLTGLEGATNLTSLNLNGNYISDISPVAGLTNLTWLRLWNNNISDISAVAGLTNLTVFFLGIQLRIRYISRGRANQPDRSVASG